jgi:protoheme IX farnesyltransferase
MEPTTDIRGNTTEVNWLFGKARDYYALCKPKVVSLIIFTAMVGMFLAVPGMVPLDKFVFGTLGIGLAAASAAAINQLLDRVADAQMRRTRYRPLPLGRVTPAEVIGFSIVLAAAAMLMLALLVNVLTSVLTFFALIGYAVIYTVFLKRATPQNIVIGGAAGAAPPVLGWAAITGHVSANALLLFMIIFTWTPPHFWALAIHRREDYAKADIPMLPVTHGVAFTGLQILFYTILLVIISIWPYLTGMSGIVYLIGALILGGIFLYYAVALKFFPNERLPMQTFGYSIVYLLLLFALLLVDHYL